MRNQTRIVNVSRRRDKGIFNGAKVRLTDEGVNGGVDDVDLSEVATFGSSSFDVNDGDAVDEASSIMAIDTE